MASCPITSWQIKEEKGGSSGILFSCTSKSPWTVTKAMKIRLLLLGKKVMTNLDSVLKSGDITSPTKVFIVNFFFPSSHVWIWRWGDKEGWAPKNQYFWTVVLERTLERPLDCQEIKPINPKGNQSHILIGKKCRGWSSDTLAPLCGKLTH